MNIHKAKTKTKIQLSSCSILAMKANFNFVFSGNEGRVWLLQTLDDRGVREEP